MRGGGGFALLLGGSLLAGAAIGVANVLIPGLLKRDFPDRLPLMTGLYTMALCVGAAAGAGRPAPLRLAFGGNWARRWRPGRCRRWGDGGGGAGLAAPDRPGRRLGVTRMRRVGGLWRDPLAWQVTLYMGLQSALAYRVFGWLAPICAAAAMTP